MALIKRKVNLWGKTRKLNEPYVSVVHNGWEWRILKAYKTRKAEREDRYARWLCAVKSPMTFGSWDMGDAYCNDVPMTAELSAALAERYRLEEATE